MNALDRNQLLSALASELASSIRNHFPLTDQPPPPCPGSLIAMFSVFHSLRQIDKVMPDKPTSFFGNSWNETWQKEAIDRLRLSAEKIRLHFAVFSQENGCSLELMPPVDFQTLKSLEWCSAALLAYSDDTPANATSIQSATALAKLRLEERYNSDTDTFDEYPHEEFLAELNDLGLAKPESCLNKFFRSRRADVKRDYGKAPQSAPRATTTKKAEKNKARNGR